MQSRKWIENWWVWIAVDILSVGLYIYKGLLLFALLYAVFMAMCIAGLLEWRSERALASQAAI
jgi:nicotinamide mononucleotide transporter